MGKEKKHQNKPHSFPATLMRRHAGPWRIYNHNSRIR